MSSYTEVVQYLESLSIMPKTMPGLEKIKRALVETEWFSKINSEKVVIVAGTNGKGSTCACLEGLLLQTGKKVGFYSSPHLIETTERIRLNGKQISKEVFVVSFIRTKSLIETHQLTHFEALTLMAGDIFFGHNELDYVIFEVGLGGTYDATNAFPHSTSVITSLSLDHTNILGNTLKEVARNKFGIVQKNNKVIHLPLTAELSDLKNEVRTNTNSKWISVPEFKLEINASDSEPKYFLHSQWGKTQLSLLGERAAENANLALTVFSNLGFEPSKFLNALQKINWPGRMQKIKWTGITCPVYLSGDHNPDGIKSLLNILKDFRYSTLHLIVGIGVDKDAEAMLTDLIKLPNSKLYLTETPFKGRKLEDYPKLFLSSAQIKNKEITQILNQLSESVKKEDLIIVTGSLYLVGQVLAETCL